MSLHVCGAIVTGFARICLSRVGAVEACLANDFVTGDAGEATSIALLSASALSAVVELRGSSRVTVVTKETGCLDGGPCLTVVTLRARLARDAVGGSCRRGLTVADVASLANLTRVDGIHRGQVAVVSGVARDPEWCSQWAVEARTTILFVGYRGGACWAVLASSAFDELTDASISARRSRRALADEPSWALHAIRALESSRLVCVVASGTGYSVVLV